MLLLSDGDATKRRAVLVTLRWGLKSVVRWTNWPQDIAISPFTWLSRPTMDVKVGKLVGSVDDESTMLTLPLETPLKELTAITAFSNVAVEIEEVDPLNFTERREVFQGMVSEVARNPQGKTGLVEATISSHKARMSVPLGIQVTTTCPWVFCDSNCGKSASAIEISATIIDIAGKNVTFADSTAITGKPQYYWKNGFVRFDGLSITIAAWGSGTRMGLKDAPPASWSGASVVLRPGCAKTLTGAMSCTYWANVSNFCGLGIKIPGRNPVFENAG